MRLKNFVRMRDDIGGTGRSVRTRLNEHYIYLRLRQFDMSAVAELSMVTNLKIDLEEIAVLPKEKT